MSDLLLVMTISMAFAAIAAFAYLRRSRQVRLHAPLAPPDPLESVLRRVSDIITSHQNSVSPLDTLEQLEARVLTCIRRIVVFERRSDLVPNEGETLSQWGRRPELPEGYGRLADRLKIVFERSHFDLKNSTGGRAEIRVAALLEGNKDIVEKFLDITERKVSALDDYGDENWDALQIEVKTCLTKISQRDGVLLNWTKPPGFKGSYTLSHAEHHMPFEYVRLSQKLKQLFRAHHSHLKGNRNTDRPDLAKLSGVEFEAHIAELLRSSGYAVQGTPATGDQGADLIAKKNGNTVVIQAKRYKGTVGNKAVQEVISALSFYDGHEGWVVTNSTFSQSAIALARKANIRLIDGTDLRNRLNL